jgi:hypothetical protein
VLKVSEADGVHTRERLLAPRAVAPATVTVPFFTVTEKGLLRSSLEVKTMVVVTDAGELVAWVRTGGVVSAGLATVVTTPVAVPTLPDKSAAEAETLKDVLKAREADGVHTMERPLAPRAVAPATVVVPFFTVTDTVPLRSSSEVKTTVVVTGAGELVARVRTGGVVSGVVDPPPPPPPPHATSKNAVASVARAVAKRPLLLIVDC